jgi:thiosulfate/3-mercaptopyruvate sulfurtransferase
MDRTIDPLVSTDWLEACLDGVAEPGLVVVDIREPRLYDAGHIPGSILIPFSPMSDWAVSDDDLLMELPPDEDLCRLLDDHGITSSSAVVLVGTVEPAPAPPYALSDAPRVAATLFHVGVANVAILEGGYPKWQAERRPSTSGVPTGDDAPAAGGAGMGHSDCSELGAAGIFVSTHYVKDRLGPAVLIDGRIPPILGVTLAPRRSGRAHPTVGRSAP